MLPYISGNRSLRMPKEFRFNFLIFLSVFFLYIISFKLRGFIPYDETRYISIAWEMWQGKNFLIPHINGNIYADKPPLLFWLINAGWYLTGVNDWWPRAISFIFAFINIYLTRHIALQLWPEIKEFKKTIPIILISMPVWIYYSIPLMFDMLQVCLVLTAISGLLQFHKNLFYGITLLGTAIGMSILLKGPVIFIYLLPLAVTLPLWNRIYPYSYGKLLLQIVASLLLCSVIVFAWIIPVIHTLGLDPVGNIFWHQTTDRIMHATSHSNPFWWYLYFLPLLLFPWFYSSGFNPKTLVKIRQISPQIIFCLTWLLAPFILFSLIDAKQLHYLLPLVPALAILIAYKLSQCEKTGVINFRLAGIIYISIGLLFLIYKLINVYLQNDFWISGISSMWALIAVIGGMLLFFDYKTDNVHPALLPGITSLVITFSLYICILLAPRPYTNLDKMGHILAQFQKNNFPIANIGTHREQFEFVGRLKRPLDKVNAVDIEQWAINHPEGYLVAKIRESDNPDTKLNIIYEQPYRFRHKLILFNSKEILKNKINLNLISFYINHA